jgi:hypothetical protein
MTDIEPTVTIPAALAIGILNYMRQRPYAEVAAGVQALEAVLNEQLPKADAE